MTCGCVVFITGLPASGKSTFAVRAQGRLLESGIRPVLLDGDDIRAALRPTPGYDEVGRSAFYSTLARLSSLLAKQGHVVLVPATAHRRAYRDEARELAPRFLEVAIVTPESECERRDPKGLYAAAARNSPWVRTGNFPGIGAAYEPPAHPDFIAQGGQDESAVVALCARICGIVREQQP